MVSLYLPYPKFESTRLSLSVQASLIKFVCTLTPIIWVIIYCFYFYDTYLKDRCLPSKYWCEWFHWLDSNFIPMDSKKNVFFSAGHVTLCFLSLIFNDESGDIIKILKSKLLRINGNKVWIQPLPYSRMCWRWLSEKQPTSPTNDIQSNKAKWSTSSWATVRKFEVFLKEWKLLRRMSSSVRDSMGSLSFW